MKTNVCRECKCIGKPSKGLINIHNIQTQDLSKEFEDKLVYCLKCPNCGHSWIPEKSTREQAIEWWGNQDQDFKMKLCIEYNELCSLHGRTPSSLTGREIESIWRQELQEASTSFEYRIMDDGSNYSDNKEMVDFEMLKETIEHLPIDLDNGCVSDTYINNIQLFFQKLSESGSFAHKAHKELQRLNK